jgi:hypothetical protein
LIKFSLKETLIHISMRNTLRFVKPPRLETNQIV